MPPAFLQADYRRVIYEQNPLAEVICQVRFPHILKIDSDPPADFQDHLRDQYPHYEVNDGIELSLVQSARDRAAPPIRHARSHSFFSDSREWHVSLAANFVALQTTKYVSWDEFQPRLRTVIEAVQAVYKVSQWTRVGLRYRNIIDRKELQIENEPWHALIAPSAIGWLETSDEHEVIAYSSTGHFRFGETQIRATSSLVQNADTKAYAFLLDNDFFEEDSIKAQDNQVLENAARLHSYSGRFFRWCITDKLHDALKPGQVPASTD
jgi:uncharacterized protein (TIGR04255 family)